MAPRADVSSVFSENNTSFLHDFELKEFTEHDTEGLFVKTLCHIELCMERDHHSCLQSL